MKKSNILLAVLLTAAVGASAPVVRAENPKGEDAPVHGTIPVAKDTPKSAYAAMAKITEKNATTAALVKAPGKVIKAELTEDDGFLLWEVHILSVKGKALEVEVDAGSGKVLAVEADDQAADKD